MTRKEAIWHANHVFNLVIERCFNAQNLKDAREFDEAKQIVIEALEQEPKTGEWEYIAHRRELLRRCSNCKWTQTYSNTKYIGYIYKFCPNCGARMGSDEE